MSRSLPHIDRLDVKGKRVIVRVDFNVPIENGRVVDDFKIRSALFTIKYLLRHGASVVLMSHLEDGGARKPTLRPVARVLEKFLRRRVYFAPVAIINADRREKLCRRHDVILLENLRKNRGEELNSIQFARELSRWGDVYVNEAFSVSHRAHASLVRLPRLLQSAAGSAFLEEVEMLSINFKKWKPLLFILGGNKFHTKVKLLDRFMKIADDIFIAGSIANTFLYAQGFDVKKSAVEKDALHVIQKKYLQSHKIKLPVDWRWNDSLVYDIGPQTIKLLDGMIKKSRGVVWNGPLGFFENGYVEGTKAAARSILKHKKKAIIGGGDTAASLGVLGVRKKFYFVSTGGGAMIEFLANGTLPGIEALKKSQKS